MKIRSWYSYAKKRNLFNRTYYMLEYFEKFSNDGYNKFDIKYCLKNNFADICFVENLITYFQEKLSQNKKKIELRCNLSDLINDLDYLKQYLDN